MLVNCITKSVAGYSVSRDCTGQPPMCDDGRTGNTKTIACFAYPSESLWDKPAFGGSTFFVSEIVSAETEQACLQAPKKSGILKTGTTLINGVRFEVFEIGDNWLGGGKRGPIYLTFHGGKCFELGRQTAMTTATIDGPDVQKFTSQDREKVETVMNQPVHSFRFDK